MANGPSRERLSQAHQVMDVVDRARLGADAVTDGEALRALVRTTYQEQGIDVDDALIESAVAQLLGKSDTLPAVVAPIPASSLRAPPPSFKTWWLKRRREKRAAALAKAALPVVKTPEDDAGEALAALRAHPLRTDADIIARLDELWLESVMARRWAGWKVVFWVTAALSGPACFILVPLFSQVGIGHLFPWMASLLTLFLLPVCAIDALAARSLQTRRQVEINEARASVGCLDYKGHYLNTLLEVKTGRMEPLTTDSVLWDIAKRGAANHPEVGQVWAAWLDSDKVIRDCDLWLLSETCDKLVAGKAWALRKQLNEQGAASQASIRTRLKGVLPSPAPQAMLAKMARDTQMQKELKLRAVRAAKEKQSVSSLGDMYEGKMLAEELCDQEMKKEMEMLNQKVKHSYSRLSDSEKSRL